MQPEHDEQWDCCCQEMRCCTPEIVTATINGFSGVLIPQYCVIASNGASPLAHKPPDLPPCSLPAYTNPGPFTGTYSRLLDSGSPSSGDCCGGNGVSCLSPHSPEPWHCGLPAWMQPDDCQPANICTSDVLWSSSAFPPKKVKFNFTESEMLCNGGGADYFKGYRKDVYWVTDTSIDCVAAPLFCQMPDTSATHYGPTLDGSTEIICEQDYNGSVVLRRTTSGLRPELYAKVNRSKPAPAGATDAVLRFDVFCRRGWEFDASCRAEIIKYIDCTREQREYPTVASVAGTWFCVDYFCNRLSDENHGVKYCDRFQCTAPYGYVWPHLLATSDSGNKSANIIPELEPASYDEGWLGLDYATNDLADKAQVPYEWIVKSLNIKNAGSGYSVGDFFTIDFDPAWAVHRSGQPRGFSLTGQLATPLSATPVCHAEVTWKDKYGAVPYGESYDEDGNVSGYYCQQRARVSAVGSRGEITEIEVVPWYQNPEFKNGDCSKRITKDEDKTPVYIRMYRVLCHPLSVIFGGSGYSVGDTITWYCKDPACETLDPAKAVVTDVDDNGAVLDWHILGSDICMYGSGGWSCSSNDESVAVRPDCSRHPYKTTDYLDERGAYKFDGKSLCELNWIGKKPVRAAVSDTIQQSNASGFRGVGVQISKEPCRTTFNLTRLTYYNLSLAPDGFRPYRYSSGLWLSIEHNTNEGESRQDEMLLKFPPYPPSEAGGAEIALTFGSESQEFADPTQCKSLGGPVQTAKVIAGGTGFAFKDKTHVQPILPLSFSELSGAEAEATIQGGAIYNWKITKAGYGYSSDSPPTVTFSAPGEGGVTATGTAYVDFGRVSGITITNSGSGYEDAPTVTIAPPTTDGYGAKLKSFSFSTVSNFPGVNYSKGEPYSATAMRFAYFPVTGVVIDDTSRGIGYKVGDTFQIKPAGGGAYTEAWGGGGDDPDSCPNGAWYEGSYSTGLLEDGRLSTPFFTEPASTGGSESRDPFCILKVTGVNATGGITGIEVVEGGMMFRSQYTTGVKHPEIFPQVSSDTGEGCEFTYTVDTNVSSEKFGEVTGVKIENKGHYYANPQSGWMWTIADISIGGASMMAWRNWDGAFYDPFHPEKSTHVYVGGSGGLPPQIRKTEACHIGECYHNLLNKAYTLYRSYEMAPGSEMIPFMQSKYEFDYYGVSWSVPEKNPAAPSWAMFRKKDAEQYADGTYGRDVYVVIEWGFTVSLSASIPSTCPDQTNGRTSGYDN